MTEAGDLLMCGRGWNGCLGLGDEEDRATPTLVARAVFDGEAVLMVACGVAHTTAVTEGGGVYTFGRGEDGQLGVAYLELAAEAVAPHEEGTVLAHGGAVEFAG